MERSYLNPEKKKIKIANKQLPPPVHFNGKEMDLLPEAPPPCTEGKL